MKERAIQLITRKKSDNASNQPAAGSRGAVAAPPGYGIDFLDGFAPENGLPRLSTVQPSSDGGIAQMKCACGAEAGSDGKCKECETAQLQKQGSPAYPVAGGPGVGGLIPPSMIAYDPLKAANDRYSAAISAGDPAEIEPAGNHLDYIKAATSKIAAEDNADRAAAARKRFGAFLAPKVLKGELSPADAARQLNRYRATTAGQKDLFFHDNAVAALAAKKKLEASNISIESYRSLAEAPELLASGRYKYLPNYRKNVEEQREEQYAEGKQKAWEEGGANGLYLFVEAQGREDAAQVVASFRRGEQKAFYDAKAEQEKARREAERNAALMDICVQDLNDPADCANYIYGSRRQTATVEESGEVKFSEAHLMGFQPEDHKLEPFGPGGYYGRKVEPKRLTEEEKAWRQEVHDAQQSLVFQQAGKQALRTIAEPGAMLADALMWMGKQYAWAFGTDFHYTNQSLLSESISAELAKGNKASYGKIAGDVALNVGTTALMFVPGGQVGVAGKIMWGLNALGKGMTAYQGASAMAEMIERRNLGDYMGAASAGGSIFGMIGQHYGMKALGSAFGGRRGGTGRTVEEIYNPKVSLDEVVSTAKPPRTVEDIYNPKVSLDEVVAGQGGERGAGVNVEDIYNPRVSLDEVIAGRGSQAPVDDPSLYALRSSGDSSRPWSKMNGWERLKTMLGGNRAVENAKALDFDVDAATDRAWSKTFDDRFIGRRSKIEKAMIAEGKAVPDPYIHAVRKGNAIEFASPTNIPIFRQILAHILFENPNALVEVGSGGHGGVRGDSFITDPAARDPSFVAANEHAAQQAGALANVWDLVDPSSLKNWLERRASASSKIPGKSNLYSIADWCWSAFSGAEGTGPMEPLLRDWEARFDAWNARQRNAGFPYATAADKSSGGLYRGSDVRAALIAEINRRAAVLNALKNPREWLRQVYGVRSSSGDASIYASRSNEGGRQGGPPGTPVAGSAKGVLEQLRAA